MLEDSTILVTEDEGPLRDLYAMWLTSAGATVKEASTGDEALEKWDETIDAVLLDRRMPPGISGGETLKQAREDGLNTPVMMLTAVDPEMEVIEMGFDDYLTKPTEREELLSVVEDLIQARQVRDEVRLFARLGVKIHELQKAHSKESLRMHTEFQKLKSQYNELLESLSVAENEFSEYEKHFLLLTRERLDESPDDGDTEATSKSSN